MWTGQNRFRVVMLVALLGLIVLILRGIGGYDASENADFGLTPAFSSSSGNGLRDVQLPPSPSDGPEGQFGGLGWELHPEVQRLLAATRTEGGVTLYTPSPADAQRVCAAFMDKFSGIGCIGRATGLQALGVIYLTERYAGEHMADVISAPMGLMSALSRRGYLRTVDWTRYGVGEQRFFMGGQGVLLRQTFFNHAYDSSRLRPEELPRTLEEFQDPKWEGQLLASPTQYYELMGYLAKDKGYDWALQFGTWLEHHSDMMIVPNPHVFIQLGERPISFTGVGNYLPQHEASSPRIKQFLTDTVVIQQHPVGVVNDAPNSNAGQLLTLFIVSEDGWRALYPGGWPPYSPDLTGLLASQRGVRDLILQIPENLAELSAIGQQFRADSRRIR